MKAYDRFLFQHYSEGTVAWHYVAIWSIVPMVLASLLPTWAAFIQAVVFAFGISSVSHWIYDREAPAAFAGPVELLLSFPCALLMWWELTTGRKPLSPDKWRRGLVVHTYPEGNWHARERALGVIADHLRRGEMGVVLPRPADLDARDYYLIHPDQLDEAEIHSLVERWFPDVPRPI